MKIEEFVARKFKGKMARQVHIFYFCALLLPRRFKNSASLTSCMSSSGVLGLLPADLGRLRSAVRGRPGLSLAP